MLSVNGLIIVFVFAFGLGLIIEHIRQEKKQQDKARRNIEELKEIFPNNWDK